jgi:fructosamine-3-kinase
MIPPAIRDDVISALRDVGDPTAIRVQPTTRGGVSDTAHLLTEQSEYFLKWNTTPWFGTFTNEAFHLSLLRATNTVRVPHVFAFMEGQEQRPAWLLQEWIGGASKSLEDNRLGAQLGRKLALLHQTTFDTASGFGYPEQQPDGSVVLPTQD